MKSINLKICGSVALALSCFACSNDELVQRDPAPDDRISVLLDVNIYKSGYEPNSRSTEGWNPGDTLFFTLKNQAGKYTGAFAYLTEQRNWQFVGNTADMLNYIADGEALAFHFKPTTANSIAGVGLNFRSCLYGSAPAGFVFNPDVKPSTVVIEGNKQLVLNPFSGRVRFRGDVGTKFLIDGLAAYNAFVAAAEAPTDAPVVIDGAEVKSDGFTEYFYTHFPTSGNDNRELNIVYPDYPNIFVRVCGENVLKPADAHGGKGKSGVITLPTVENHPEWTIVVPGSVAADVDILTFAGYATAAQQFSVDSDGDYTVTLPESVKWVHIDDAGDNKHNVSVDENLSDTPRDAVITLTRIGRYGKVLTDNVAVHQKARSGDIDRGDFGDDENWDELTQGTLQVATREIFFDHTASSENVPVKSTFSFTASVDGGNWLNYSIGEGLITVNADANNTPHDRTAQVKLRMQNPVNTSLVREDSIKVTQTKHPRGQLAVSVDNFELSFQKQTSLKATVTATYDYTISKSDGDWFSFEQSGNEFTVTVTENEGNTIRRGYVVVAMPDPIYEETITDTIAVVQDFCNVKIDFEDYGDDENWDTGSSAAISVGRDDYETDTDLDTGSSSDSDVDRDDYGDDTNHDTGSSSDSDVDRDDYGDDTDYGSGSSGSIDVGRDDYGEDDDYNKDDEES